MIGVEIDVKQLRQLREATAKAKKKLPRELAAAINATARKVRTQISKDIRKKVALKAKDVKQEISLRNKATAEHPVARVSLKKTKRLGLNKYGARQDKRGVSYKIDKQGGRKRVDGAFQGPKPGAMKMSWKGNAFKRVGKARLPIVKLMGPSPYGVYAKNEMAAPQAKDIKAELSKQMERRIKLNILRAEGLVAK